MANVRWFLAALLLCASLPGDAINVRVKLQANPDGVRSTAFPCLLADRSDCAPPSTALLVWSSVANIAVLNGSTSSRNVRSLYLAGTLSATATLSLLCSPSLSGGFTAGADGESWSSSTAYSGICQWTATAGSNPPLLSNFFSISSSATVTDTRNPTMPTGIAVALNASNQPVVSFDPPCDNQDLDTYTIVRDGGNLTPVAFTQQPSVVALTSADVGTMSPSGTTTLSNGYDYLDTAEGDLGSTTDEFRFSQRSVPGDFMATVKVESFTDAPDNFSKAALMARDGLAADAAYVDSQVRSAGSVKLEYRTTAGAARTTSGSTSANSFPVWQQLVRSGDNWTVSQSTDGGTWTPVISNQSVSLPATLNVGLATTSTTQGTTVTVQYRGFCLRTGTGAARLSYTDTTATAGAHTYAVFAKDTAGNSSTTSPTLSITVPGSVSNAIMWHPGQWMLLATNTAAQAGGQQTADFANIDLIASEPNVKGVEFQIAWSSIESSQDVYSWTITDAYVAKAAAVGKKIIFRLQDRCFNCGATAAPIPAYVKNIGGTNQGVAQTKNGSIARLWNPAVMDRYIALVAAFGTQYNANTTVEGFSTEESTPGFNGFTPPSDYSNIAFHTQWRRLFPAARAAMPNKQILWMANWLTTDCYMAESVKALYNAYGTLSSPDTIATEINTGQKIYTGVAPAAGTCTQFPAHDYTGTMAHWPKEEAASLGGAQGNQTPQQVYDFAKNTLHANAIVWRRNTWFGTPAQQWDGGILPLIRNNATIYSSSCPSSWPGCQ